MPEPPPDDRLAGLLSAWFAAYSDGRDPAAEELTSDPHLLPLLRDGIAAAKRLDPARTTQVPPEAGTPTMPIPAARPYPSGSAGSRSASRAARGRSGPCTGRSTRCCAARWR